MPFDADAAIVSHASLSRSGLTLKAFIKTHLTYHNVVNMFFTHFGTWVTLEGLVYGTDTINEEGDFEQACNGLDLIREFLESRGLFDGMMAAELAHARDYFSWEKRYMRSKLPVEDIRAAAVSRSFDFHLLHRALWRIQGWPYDETVFQWFSKFEQVMEFDDDSTSIEKDRAAGTFNVVGALSAHGDHEVIRYGDDLIQGVEDAMKALGPRFATMLQVYHAVAPDTILACLLERGVVLHS